MQIILSLLIVGGCLFGASLLKRLAARFADKHDYEPVRLFQIAVLINATMAVVAVLLLSVVWGFSGRGIAVFFSSIFALIGVALFASWSILSNVTAALILFFSAPFQVGDRIRVLDGDNTVTGKVSDIGLIYLTLKDEDGNFFTLPNNVLLQKTIIRLAEGKELPCDKKHVR
jgi:small-conductance mechanosensitive channel